MTVLISLEGGDLPLQTVCSVSGENFLQEFSLHLGPVLNGPWPQGVEPNFGFVLQCQGKKF